MEQDNSSHMKYMGRGDYFTINDSHWTCKWTPESVNSCAIFTQYVEIYCFGQEP